MWRLIGDLADELHAEKWKEFGALNFPRVTLGRLAVECPRLPDDRTAQDKLRENLHTIARVKERIDKLDTVGIDVSQALNAGQSIVKLLFSVLRFVPDPDDLREQSENRFLCGPQ